MYFKKYTDGSIEYINASDVFKTMNEEDPKAQEIFAFMSFVEQEMNYYNDHSSTAFGNPDLARIEGIISGYCMAKGWDIVDSDGYRFIKSGNKIIFTIEIPKISQSEIDNRNDIRKTLRDMGF